MSIIEENEKKYTAFVKCKATLLLLTVPLMKYF